MGVIIDVDCTECGGYSVPLDSAERAHLVRAQLRRSSCHGCATRAWRSGEAAGVLPDMWWDTITWEWMVTFPLGDATVTLPTGVRGIWARSEAHAAALALVDPAGFPIMVAEEGRPRSREQLSLFFAAHRWRLSVPCFDCGGFDLALGIRRPSAVHRALAEAKEMLISIGRDCPNCLALEEREAAEADCDGEPRLWFDPAVGDWVLSRPIGGMGAVTLPLGIGRLDPDPWVLEHAAMRLLGQRGDEPVA